MLRWAAYALWSHWRRHPVQLGATLTGLALATGLWSAVQAINAEARASYAEAAQQLGAAGGTILEPRAGSIPLATYVALRRAGWQLAPVLEGRARLGGEWITVMGVDVLSHPALPAITAADGLSAGELVVPGRLFARAETAAALAGLPDLPPVIATDRVPPGVILTDIGVAERLLHRPGEISRLVVLTDQLVGLTPLDRLAPELTPRVQRGAADMARLTDSFHLNLTAFGLLSFAVGLFIVHGTIGLAFEERRGLFRTLRALGLPAATLTRMVLGELLLLALAGGLLGMVLGYLVAAALLPDVAASLRGLYGAPVDDGLSLRPGWVAAGLGMAMLGTLAAAARGLHGIVRLPILAGAGVQSWRALGRRQALIQAVAGLALIAGGSAAVPAVGGLAGGFALLAGLMLGAALLLPPVLHGALGVIARRARGPVAVWFWADTRSQLPALSLALMSLLLALAANIGVGTMVSSFRLTFTGWLDQRLAAELYVTADDDRQGTEIAAWLAGRVEAVLPIRHAERRIAGQEVRLYGIADHATYRDHWPLIAAVGDVWPRLYRGEAALVNEQLARRAGLWPGAQLDLGPGLRLTVAGVYSDYGNPQGQVIVALPLLERIAPDAENRQFGIRVAPERAGAVAQALRARFDLPLSAIADQSAIKARSLAVFEKTFVVTGALNVLTLGVAGFAIFTALLTLWNARLAQLAPLWALGLTRARLARIEMLRSAAMAALTAAAALPLGLALAWVLLAVINVEAFGWRLRMHLFPVDWLRLFGLAIAAALAAALLPARRLARVPPADLLKVFASER